MTGGDWIQTATSDKDYSAVDLMEIAVKVGVTVSVAFDDRLAKPSWLSGQFQPTDLSLTINGKPMKIYQHRAAKDESLTLGSNSETPNAQGNMYVVFASTTK